MGGLERAPQAPQMFGAPRRSRGAPLSLARLRRPRTGPLEPPKCSERPGAAVALLCLSHVCGGLERAPPVTTQMLGAPRRRRGAPVSAVTIASDDVTRPAAGADGRCHECAVPPGVPRVRRGAAD